MRVVASAPVAYKEQLSMAELRSGAPVMERRMSSQSRRILELTRFVSAEDVRAAVGCSLSSAYRMMRTAAAEAGLQQQKHALKRLPQLVWERYAARRFGC